MKTEFDVAVIGGGHAGIEAAWLSSKIGARTLLVTMDKSKIGAMHCNPSVGGLGKGHLVFELSALGGLMPKMCSYTHLQARMLNTKKGPAVQGLRLQIDKKAYSELASKTICNAPGITVLEDEVIEVLTSFENFGKRLVGIKTSSGKVVRLKSLVVATGTFLRGKIFIGPKEEDCTKVFNKTSSKLSESLECIMDVKLGRLRTGTPPRLAKRSVDFDKIDLQPSHEVDWLFEFEPKKSVTLENCFVTHTNEDTHRVIKDNLDSSALFSGSILAAGPRYCPAIEVKLVRFPDKNSHHIFVEPEVKDGDLIYPSGLSNALPFKVQEKFIRTIRGFENAEVVRPGFEIEYDFLQPTGLDNTLQSKQVSGLFFAGQINGTTGYEEAATQGAIAGINAALFASRKEPFVIQRWEGYIGVMIDDLVTLGVDEPYRMFTSRAERRLILRQDNAFARLMPKARSLGLIDDSLWEKFQAEESLVAKIWSFVDGSRFKRQSLFKKFDVFALDDQLKEELTWRLISDLKLSEEERAVISGRLLARIHAMVRYDGYIGREEAEAQRMEKYASVKIPPDFDYYSVQGLRKELQDKLTKVAPKTIGQAMLIPGMTPAAISVLAVMANKHG